MMMRFPMRIMIINWRWKMPDNIKSIEISLKNEALLITQYYHHEIQAFNDFISTNLFSFKPKEVLVLSHNNQSSPIRISKNDIHSFIRNDLTMKIQEFMGGDQYIYWGTLNTEGIIDTNRYAKDYEEQIKLENFSKVWDYYWNKLDLQYHKKEIVNSWLPFVIDIQGLRDLNQSNIAQKVKEKKLMEYCDSIIRSIDAYPDTYFEKWDDAKNILSPDDGTEVLGEQYQLKPRQKYLIFRLIEKELSLPNGKQCKKIASLTKYIENFEPEHPDDQKECEKIIINPFFPKWLRLTNKILDKKIYSKPVQDAK